MESNVRCELLESEAKAVILDSDISVYRIHTGSRGSAVTARRILLDQIPCHSIYIVRFDCNISAREDAVIAEIFSQIPIEEARLNPDQVGVEIPFEVRGPIIFTASMLPVPVNADAEIMTLLEGQVVSGAVILARGISATHSHWKTVGKVGLEDGPIDPTTKKTSIL